MTRTCLLILGLCLPLAGCPIDGIDGNGDRVDETRELERFSVVESRGSLGHRDRAGRRLLGRGQHRFQPDPLRRHPRQRRTPRDRPRRSDRRHRARPARPADDATPREATLSGSGTLDVSDFEQDQPMQAHPFGLGEVAFSGSAPQVRADSAARATCCSSVPPRVVLDLSGSGTIDAEQLEAETGDIELRGSGDVRATVRDAARVALDGSGDIDLFGQPSVEVLKRAAATSHVRPWTERAHACAALGRMKAPTWLR